MFSQVKTSDFPGGTTPPRTRRLLVWLLGGTAAVVALLVVAAVVALRTVDLSGFTGTILAAVQRETGRQLTVGKGPYLRDFALAVPGGRGCHVRQRDLGLPQGNATRQAC